jgi:geranylgeranyl reductase family protein
MITTDVCIVGAGPSGALAALFLAKKGIPSLLVDKSEFPRDKICGDGLSGWVVSVLHALDPDVLLRLNESSFALHSYGMRIVAPNGRILDLPFAVNELPMEGLPPGYTCKRIHFDQFLIDEVQNQSGITFMDKTIITGYSRSQGGMILETSANDRIRTQMVVFANGANSIFMKDPGGIHKSKKYTMTGLKTYYKGITGFHNDNYVELHFLKGILPGYLWLFPLSENEANVGIGLDQERIGRKKINLKQFLFDAIKQEPHLRERFKSAEQIAPVQAYRLPLWDGRRTLSGERFLLAGDAASMIDPVTGEGIGHAAITGMYAARQVERSLRTGNYTAQFMGQYDQEVYEKIGKELSISSKIPRFIRYPWLFNAMINKATNSKTVQDKLSRAMTDLEVRKRLKEPSLYIKMLLGK